MLLTLAISPALAGPGAHGPNGEHLDDPGTPHAASARPRMEASTDAFELVAELHAGELVIVVDRYASNEPVTGARLEVESGAFKAVATYRAEQGDYAVTDAAMLKALAEPGEHGLVFTLVAGPQSDLLDGTLVGPARREGAAAAAGQSGQLQVPQGSRAAWVGGGGLVALLLVGTVAWRFRRRRRHGAQTLQGGL